MVGSQVALAAGLGLRASKMAKRCRVWQEVHEPSEPSRFSRPTPTLGHSPWASLPSLSSLSTVPWQAKQPTLRSASEFMPLFSQGSIFQMISRVLACLERAYWAASSGWQREQSLGVTAAATGILYSALPKDWSPRSYCL